MALVFVGVPVFRGRNLIHDALESIRTQEFEDFRVMVSVDGNDRKSLKVCLPFAADPRFEIVLQHERLGWPGNLNWLHRQAREDFFCYSHQDNRFAPSYLRVLVEHASAHPEASCVYCDIQGFAGEKSKLMTYPEITGSAQERILQQMAQNRSTPHHGLIRREALRSAGPRWTEYQGAKSDAAWIVRLAREGELHRIPETLCTKFLQRNSVSRSWQKYLNDQWREITILWGLNVLEGALPAFSGEEPKLLELIVERIAIGRKRRGLYFDVHEAGPGETLRLVADFLREARERYGVTPVPKAPASRDAVPALAQRLADGSASRAEQMIAAVVLNDLLPREGKRRRSAAAKRTRERPASGSAHKPAPDKPLQA